MQSLYEDDEYGDGDDHDPGVKALIAIRDGKISESPSADGACHGRCPDESDGGDGEAEDEGAERFRDKETEDDLGGCGPHGFRCLDDAFVDFKEGVLNQSCNIRSCIEDQWYNGRGRPDRCSHDQAGEGYDRHHQDDERDGPEDVHDPVQDGKDKGILPEMAFPSDDEEHPEGQSDHGGKEEGEAGHDQCFNECVDDLL